MINNVANVGKIQKEKNAGKASKLAVTKKKNNSWKIACLSFIEAMSFWREIGCIRP